MQILIVSATSLEIEPFMSLHPTADILITGVGTVMTTYQLTKRLQQIDYDLIIQAGVAGAFNTDLKLSEVVTISRDTFGSPGVYEHQQFHTLFEKGLWEDASPFSNGWLVNTNPLLKTLPFRIADAVTVDLITDDLPESSRVFAKFNPEVESMEGAALHYVCLVENVPFIQVRAISNFAGERNKQNWKLDESISALNDALQFIYKQLIPSDETHH